MKRGRGIARRSLPFLVASTGGFLIAYLIVALFVFPAKLVSSDLPVPNVTGIDYVAAKARLEAAGFKVARGEQRYTTGAPEGAVLSQSPVPGSVEPKGSAVVLDVSRGQRSGEVPRLVGLTRQQAELAIQNAGLDVGDVTATADDAPRGQVLSASPEPGTRVPIPSAVSIEVSDGPGTVRVPDVTGQDYASARSLLAQLGFLVGRVTVDTMSAFPPNTVVGQSPAANSSAAAGATITLTISGGP
jgi:eukaryotic-like serine/threonine-protein kinase